MSPRLFFLVLASCSICCGQNQTATSRNRSSDALTTFGTPTSNTSTPSTLYHQDWTSPKETALPPNATAHRGRTEGQTTTLSNKVHDPGERIPTTPAQDVIAVSASETASAVEAHHSWGYALLVLLAVVIMVLLVILYLLRRTSQMYSFDLQRRAPGNHESGPAGNFEVLSLDDRGQEIPVANGTVPQPEEQAPQEQVPVNHRKISNIGDSNLATLDNTSEKTDPSDTTQEERDKADNNPCEALNS
ncbi:uncharacterized protein LOC133494392 isoform X2 [Syngnathoides biaculeatus]|uniref:uncharacterized protein LOC133494392 isoform X2 n=1 Tax=Syngnathoides biaculeatus TaxID=300417 RepID=UPI002ADD6F48|nr:uncharacterized protein LOC133494392 isoform X2 [Syngnathoides biaculeatus]